jgi:penicillin-binding protein 1A
MSEMARQTIVEQYGEDVLSHGYRVTTTIDSRLQMAAQEAVRRALRSYDRRHGYRGAEEKIDLEGRDGEADMDAYLATVTDTSGSDARPGDKRVRGQAEVYIWVGAAGRAELEACGLGSRVPQRQLARPATETGHRRGRGRRSHPITEGQ